ncbi:MAG: N-acetylneuraminate synthase family protein [Lachnospiraceae bacterium]|nr:N-acetylneuraminate synthase family protein [Lachnospiraceae bacterium]
MDYYSKIKEQGYYIIAEVGVNYYEIAEKYDISLIDAAKKMMFEAKNAGADCVKFQTYKAGKLAMKDSPGSWDRNDIAVETQYELFTLYDKFNASDYEELYEYSKEIGIDFMSTPFDEDSSDYLNDYMEVYKISSSDISNYPLITNIAKKNKPIIMSVGAADLDEIEAEIELIKKYNDKQITILHCVLEYSTPYEHANLLKIKSLKEKYPDAIIGYSDHTKPDEHMDVIKTAYLLGAKVIEKHFTLDKTIKFKNDHFHSMDPDDLRKIKQGFDFINKIKGSGDIICLPSEVTTKESVRRSAVCKDGIKKGEILTYDKIVFKRPFKGLSPSETDRLIGKKAKKDIAEDELILKNDFE